MARGDLKYKLVNGAASATLATAVSNWQTAFNTFQADSTTVLFPNGVIIVNAGVSVAPDAAVANDQYMAWSYCQYQAAS